MNRRLLAIAAVPAALALAPAASAQLPVNPPGNPPPPPAAAPAKLAIGLHSGIIDRKTRWEVAGDSMLVIGQVKPFVAGQQVRVELYLKGKRVGHRSVKVKKGSHGNGRFQVRLGIHRDGKYTVIARHDATPQQQAARSKKQHFRALQAGIGGEESTRLLQIGLRRMAFVAPLTGHLDDATRRAVLAYRKVNRYSRNYSVNSTVFRRIFNKRGAFHLRYGGTHAEADLSRQVLVLARDGKPFAIYTVSSGKPSTPTIKGAFRFYRRQPGYNAEGMYYSTYFHGGYAVHGYASVPATYPASHGCIRVPIPDAYRIYSSISLGEPIYVYS